MDGDPRRFSARLAALVPPPEADATAYLPAFREIATLVLNGVTLAVAGVPHRFTEVEFYWNGPRHPDTFTHGDEMQRACGRWYFHRMAGEYRGGTYKGLDIAFGRAEAPGGILVRGIERIDATPTLLDGPCMCVDHVLGLTGRASVAELVATFDRGVDPPDAGASPLAITVDAQPRTAAPVWESPRVGLSLKRGASDARVHYIAQPYRFLTEPARIKKGRLHLVIGLHRQGRTDREIARLTGATLGQVNKYLAQYDAGKPLDPKAFRKDLSTDETCQLFGACERYLAPTAPSSRRAPAQSTLAGE
jgi:3-methyladenine DNA glycosylase Mpg